MNVGAWEKQVLVSKRQTAQASIVRRKRERFSELLAIGVVVVDPNKFIAVFLFLPVVDPATARSERGEENHRERAFHYPAPDSDHFLHRIHLTKIRVNYLVRQRLIFM